MDQGVLDMLVHELDGDREALRLEDDWLYANGNAIPVSRERRSTTDLSPAQRVLIDYILAHPDESAFFSAVELGGRVGVSESTVVRFAVAIGLPGFPALQELLRGQVRHKLSISARIEGLSEVAAGVRGVPDIVCRADLENLSGTYEALSGEDFERSIELISSAERVFVVGMRTSAALAVFFAVAMRYIGRRVEHVDHGAGDHWERLSFITPRDALLAICFRNYNKLTVDMLEFACGSGVAPVVITDSAMAPTREFAAVSLIVQRSLTSLVESSTAPLSLLNAIVLGVALLREEDSIRTLKHREALWQERGIYRDSASRQEKR